MNNEIPVNMSLGSVSGYDLLWENDEVTFIESNESITVPLEKHAYSLLLLDMGGDESNCGTNLIVNDPSSEYEYVIHSNEYFWLSGSYRYVKVNENDLVFSRVYTYQGASVPGMGTNRCRPYRIYGIR